MFLAPKSRVAAIRGAARAFSAVYGRLQTLMEPGVDASGIAHHLCPAWGSAALVGSPFCLEYRKKGTMFALLQLDVRRSGDMTSYRLTLGLFIPRLALILAALSRLF